MGRSLYEGWVASEWSTESIAVTDLNPALAVGNGRLLEKTNRQSMLIVVAVKPQHVIPAIENLRPKIRSEDLVVSIAAGTSLNAIEAALKGRGQPFRAMPNIAVRVRQSAVAFCGVPGVPSQSVAALFEVFSRVGHCVELNEIDFDAFTALAGSGPAFVYEFVESLAKAGNALGLSDEIARSMSRQTVLGAAALLSETGRSPAELRDAATSPNGTTAAGLDVLASGERLEKLVIQTLKAARDRSREL